MPTINPRPALDLHTDLSNIRDYMAKGNVNLVRELVMAEETNMLLIQTMLDTVRSEIGSVPRTIQG